MLFIFFMVVIGIGWTRANTLEWWRAAVYAFVSLTMARFLFNASGTLDDPAGDGIITMLVRSATEDGRAVQLVFVPGILIGYVLPIWFLVRAYRASAHRPQ